MSVLDSEGQHVCWNHVDKLVRRLVRDNWFSGRQLALLKSAPFLGLSTNLKLVWNWCKAIF